MRAARALADADRSAIPSARVENPAVACRITDAISDPVDTAQTYVEELLRLPGCFLCYTPMRSPPAVAPAPCAASGFVTFGSFNALAKITDEVIEVRGGGGGVLESSPAPCARRGLRRVFALAMPRGEQLPTPSARAETRVLLAAHNPH